MNIPDHDGCPTYSPRGATVVVRTGWDCDRAFFEVDDEGPGIAENERGLVFERFCRGQAAQGVAGTGLWLYIVRTLARAMEGEATLMDGPDGTGTRARISLPLMDSSADGLSVGPARLPWGRAQI